MDSSSVDKRTKRKAVPLQSMSMASGKSWFELTISVISAIDYVFADRLLELRISVFSAIGYVSADRQCVYLCWRT